jgi:hypothetical protein
MTNGIGVIICIVIIPMFMIIFNLSCNVLSSSNKMFIESFRNRLLINNFFAFYIYSLYIISIIVSSRFSFNNIPRRFDSIMGI